MLFIPFYGCKLFGDRIIACNFTVSWLSRSPDPTPMNFWLWGYLKFKAYTSNPRNLSELKDAKKRKFLQIPPAIIR